MSTDYTRHPDGAEDSTDHATAGDPPSLEMPALAPVVGEDGEILAPRETSPADDVQARGAGVDPGVPAAAGDTGDGVYGRPDGRGDDRADERELASSRTQPPPAAQDDGAGPSAGAFPVGRPEDASVSGDDAALRDSLTWSDDEPDDLGAPAVTAAGSTGSGWPAEGEAVARDAEAPGLSDAGPESAASAAAAGAAAAGDTPESDTAVSDTAASDTAVRRRSLFPTAGSAGAGRDAEPTRAFPQGGGVSGEDRTQSLAPEQPEQPAQPDWAGDSPVTAATPLRETRQTRESLDSPETWDAVDAVDALDATPSDDRAATRTLPAATGTGAATATLATSRTTAGESPARSATEPDGPVWQSRTPTASEDDVLLDGSTVVGRPKSRAAAHWASLLVTLVAVPAAWFLVHDGAQRSLDALAPFDLGRDTRGLLELAGGLLAAVIALWTARRSSLGAVVVGLIATVLGIVALAVPRQVGSAITPFLERLNAHSTLGSDIASFLWSDTITGKLVALGVTLLMIGVVSHSARRAGRREQEVIDRVRRAG